MKIGERGQVTIPKKIRERFGLKPHAEVQFQVMRGALVLRKKARKLRLEKWRGHGKRRLFGLRVATVDKYIEEIRGR